MERVRPDIPKVESHSSESFALQEAGTRAGETGAFVYLLKYFVADDGLERTEDGQLRSRFTLFHLNSTESDRSAGEEDGPAVHHLPGEKIDIGYHAECEIVIDWDPAVSRAHAELKRAGADWYVDNLDRTNGTLVNGEGFEGAEERLLVNGDRIRVGDTVLIFRQPGIGPAREPVPAVGLKKPPDLTGSQVAVLRALAAPLLGADPLIAPASNNEIADVLERDLETVKGHLTSLYRAFGLTDAPAGEKRRRLAWQAIDVGLVN
jgi:hypothetical protein